MRVLVTGAGGQLGTDVVSALEALGNRHQVVGATRSVLDVSDRDSVLGAIMTLRPELIVHAAAWTAVDACESDPDRAYQLNALGCRNVAEGARLAGSHLVAVSTDYVFDGESPRPYLEWDPPNPQSVYGRSKLAGEREVIDQLPGATVVRTSWVCGVNGANMVKTILRLAASHPELAFVDDQVGHPTFTDDLAAKVVELGSARLPGLFHVTNQGATSWYGFAREVVAAMGRDPGMIRPISTAQLNPPRPARRPANSVLDNAALRMQGVQLLPDYHGPLERSVKTLMQGGL
jgi:dTDP-4-dehydrorhamnose reductase